MEKRNQCRSSAKGPIMRLALVLLLFSLMGCAKEFKYQAGDCIKNIIDSPLESFWSGHYAKVEGFGSANPSFFYEGYVLKIFEHPYGQDTLIWGREWIDNNTILANAPFCAS